jgi:hypothetical protein
VKRRIVEAEIAEVTRVLMTPATRAITRRHPAVCARSFSRIARASRNKIVSAHQCSPGCSGAPIRGASTASVLPLAVGALRADIAAAIQQHWDHLYFIFLRRKTTITARKKPGAANDLSERSAVMFTDCMFTSLPAAAFAIQIIWRVIGMQNIRVAHSVTGSIREC